MFSVVEGGRSVTKKRTAKKHGLYQQEYLNNKYGFSKQPDRLKAVFYGIKYYAGMQPDTMDEHNLLVAFTEITDIKYIAGTLSIREMENIFPVNKVYDGRKYECKDFFSTQQYLATKEMEIPIGADNIDDFFWNYYNNDIMNFSIKEMIVLDKLIKSEGKKGILESFMESIGEEFHAYSIDRENNKAYDTVTGEAFDIVVPKNKEEDRFSVITNTNLPLK